jgi:hypothetical protein
MVQHHPNSRTSFDMCIVVTTPKMSTMAISYLGSNVNDNLPVILRELELALAYSCKPSICSKYIIRLLLAGIVYLSSPSILMITFS